MRALLLLAPFLCSGCGVLGPVFEADFEPVFVPALWKPPSQTTHTAWLPGPKPAALQRAARTGQGVWHVETHMDDGTLRHHVYDPGHPGLRAGDQALEAWASPGYLGDVALLHLCVEPWPSGALPLPVLAGPGAELGGRTSPTPAQQDARDLFLELAEPWGDGEGTVLRLAADRGGIEVALPEGEWRPLARYRQESRRVEVSTPRRRARGMRLVEGTLKSVLTPPAVALDAGYLGVVGTAKVVAGVAVAPLVLVFLLAGGGRGWGGC